MTRCSHGIQAVAMRLLVAISLAACSDEDRVADQRWDGAMDTLSSGVIAVANPARGVWTDGQEWRLAVTLRLGAVEGEGPSVFGSVSAVAVDSAGRIWIMDAHADELRVFSDDGNYVRTIGRRGGGPGEFQDVAAVDVSPAGDIWVADPGNQRISILDSAGVYLDSRPIQGGFRIRPWPGRFDERGRYYTPVLSLNGRPSMILTMRDTAWNMVDSIIPPRDPVVRQSFDYVSSQGRISAGIPLQGNLRWQVFRSGTLWTLLTDDYRLTEFSVRGDTMRTIRRLFTPLEVSDEDRQMAREDLQWFIEQGGQVDWSRLPKTKPPVTGLFLQDNEENIWVELEPYSRTGGQTFDIFSPVGVYYGQVFSPVRLEDQPAPFFVGRNLYGVVHDELDVPSVVRLTLTLPASRGG